MTANRILLTGLLRLLAVVLVLCLPRIAKADSDGAALHPATLGRDSYGRRKASIRRGAPALGRAEDFGAAYAKFKSAYDASKDPRLLWNMAAMQKSLHHYASAQRLLRKYVAEASSLICIEERLEVEGLIKNFELLTAELRITRTLQEHP